MEEVGSGTIRLLRTNLKLVVIKTKIRTESTFALINAMLENNN